MNVNDLGYKDGRKKSLHQWPNKAQKQQLLNHPPKTAYGD